MTNDELDAKCKAIREHGGAQGDPVVGAPPSIRMEPGKDAYPFDPKRKVEKLTIKKRSNWRIDVSIVPLPELQEHRKRAPTLKGTVTAAAIEGGKLHVWPVPLADDTLEIEYAKPPGAGEQPSMPQGAPAGRHTLHLNRPKPA